MSDLNLWAPNSGQLDLEDSEIHVWRAFLECEETVLHQFEATLSAEEKNRADRFVFRGDRNHFVVTRGVLRELLGRYLSCSPADLEFDYGPKGKPALRRNSFEPPLQFNVSHSHDLALLAFAVGRRLGIDVEFIRPMAAAVEIAERYFAGEEAAELRTMSPSLQTEGFFLCWTRKEAYIKAKGDGLHTPLESFRVSLTPGEPERLESEDSCRWSIRSLDPAPHYVGALVAEGRDWRLHQWDWQSQDSR
jgi:4'-phosphopantetheinyl transferase